MHCYRSKQHISLELMFSRVTAGVMHDNTTEANCRINTSSLVNYYYMLVHIISESIILLRERISCSGDNKKVRTAYRVYFFRFKFTLNNLTLKFDGNTDKNCLILPDFTNSDVNFIQTITLHCISIRRHIHVSVTMKITSPRNKWSPDWLYSKQRC